MMIRPRILAKTIAAIGGYFWLPCPICRKNFAGFEWGCESLMDTPFSGEGVCSKRSCEEEARRRNDLFRSKNPFVISVHSTPEANSGEARMLTVSELAEDAFLKNERVKALELMNTPTDYEERRKAFLDLAEARAAATRANAQLRIITGNAH